MSGIIKKSSPLAPNSVLSLHELAENAHAREADQLRARIEQLEADLALREDIEDSLRQEIEDAFARGQSKGVEMGLLQAEDQQSERLALLKDALTQAKSEISETLAGAERLASLLARECLDILFADPLGRMEVVTDLIRAQIGRIDPSQLLAVVVAVSDFPDAGDLAKLAHELGLTPENISARNNMSSGDCLFQLQLGEMNIGIGQQWGQLATALDATENH